MSPLAETEWKTRKERIDTKLKALSPAWKIVRYHDDLDTGALTNHAVEEFPTYNGPADYALFVHGRLLGIIEAKKVSVDPRNVLEQAKRYSRGFKSGFSELRGGLPPCSSEQDSVIMWALFGKLPAIIYPRRT